MPDDGAEEVDQLIADLLERAMEHAVAIPAKGWSEVLREWDELTALEIVDVVEQLDDGELRALTSRLLRRQTVLRRNQAMAEVLPALPFSDR